MACEAGQRTTPHEPCWHCGGPTSQGAIWPIMTTWSTEVGR